MIYVVGKADTEHAIFCYPTHTFSHDELKQCAVPKIMLPTSVFVDFPGARNGRAWKLRRLFMTILRMYCSSAVPRV